MKKVFAPLLMLFALQGCALTDAELEVGHDPSVVTEGPISEAPSRIIMVTGMEDARDDQERVGYKKNGFGQNTADITTIKPVSDIVTEAIDHAIESNGHTIGPDGIEISGTINEFWVDVDINFSHIEMICNVEADLLFKDSQNAAVFYSNTYRGSHREKKQMATEGNYEAVISGAVQALIDEIVFDEELAEAFQGQ